VAKSIKGLKIYDGPVAALDFLPTISKLTNVKDVDFPAMDGADISSLILGKVETILNRKPLLWCFYNTIGEETVALRHGNYKILAKLKSKKGDRLKSSNLTVDNIDIVQGSELVDFRIYNIK